MAMCWLGSCSPGSDGSWTVIDGACLPAQLRVILGAENGDVHVAGYHAGALAGVLLQGEDGIITSRQCPFDLLWDYTFVAMARGREGELWLAGSAHLFRVEGDDWDVYPAPEPVQGGVTAAAFMEDGKGWIVGQSWAGPRIYRFEDGQFSEEAVEEGLEDVSLASIIMLDDGTGYAAGARMVSPQEGVLLARAGEAWTMVVLPDDPVSIGPIRDLTWAGDGPEYWAVGDLILESEDGIPEVVTFPYGEDFTPRVAAFPAANEGWIAGFGTEPVYHLRYNKWEAVPAERLSPNLAEGSERTWLFDDVNFASRRNGWMIATFIDCDVDGVCVNGQAMLHYDRDDSTRSWIPDRSWVRPPDTGEAAPEIVPTAVTVEDDELWIAGDSSPAELAIWGAPRTYRELDGNSWVDAGIPAEAGIRDIKFDDQGSGWAVGSRMVDEENVNGVIFHWDGSSWEEEPTDAVNSSHWELRGVDWGTDGVIYAVGWRHHLPLVLARVDDVWEVVPCDDWGGSTALLDLTVDVDGVIWATGTTIRDGGASEGFLVRGDTAGFEVYDLRDQGVECGDPSDPYDCWTLLAIDAWEQHVVAVGESTMFQFDDGELSKTRTNMTLVDVAHAHDGRVWVLAENGWWVPDDGGENWTVHRTWDSRADEGAVLRLLKAAPYFERVIGVREFGNAGLEPPYSAVTFDPNP